MTEDYTRTINVNSTITYNHRDQITSEYSHHRAFVFKGFFNGTIPIALKRYEKN